MSVLVVSASFSSSCDVELRTGRRAHRVRAIRIGRGGLVLGECAERLPARAVLGGEAERGRERLDAGLLAGGVAALPSARRSPAPAPAWRARRGPSSARSRSSSLRNAARLGSVVGLGRRDGERPYRARAAPRAAAGCCGLLRRRPFCALRRAAAGPSARWRRRRPGPGAARSAARRPAARAVPAIDRRRNGQSSHGRPPHDGKLHIQIGAELRPLRAVVPNSLVPPRPSRKVQPCRSTRHRPTCCRSSC